MIQAVGFSAWSASSGDYFSALSSAGAASSCKLEGPCYPVVTSQANQWHVCHTSELSDLPLSSTAVNGLTDCIACCAENTPSADATCNVMVRKMRNCARARAHVRFFSLVC